MAVRSQTIRPYENHRFGDLGLNRNQFGPNPEQLRAAALEVYGGPFT